MITERPSRAFRCICSAASAAPIALSPCSSSCSNSRSRDHRSHPNQNADISFSGRHRLRRRSYLSCRSKRGLVRLGQQFKRSGNINFQQITMYCMCIKSASKLKVSLVSDPAPHFRPHLSKSAFQMETRWFLNAQCTLSALNSCSGDRCRCRR